MICTLAILFLLVIETKIVHVYFLGCGGVCLHFFGHLFCDLVPIHHFGYTKFADLASQFLVATSSCLVTGMRLLMHPKHFLLIALFVKLQYHFRKSIYVSSSINTKSCFLKCLNKCSRI